MRIGFVLITHNRVEAAMRLIRQLDAMFDRPTFAWHHDFAQTPFDRTIAKPFDIRFVEPQVKTSWGSWSIVEATMRGIETLYRRDEQGPDYFYVISGACFPIRTAEQMIADLTSEGADAFMQARKLEKGQYERQWDQDCYERYCTKKKWLPWFSKRKLRPIWKEFTFTSPPWGWPLFPYSKRREPYAGGHFFCASRRAAELMRDHAFADASMLRHYKTVRFPEESFFQTFLYSRKELRVAAKPLTFTAWAGDRDPHPETLTMTHLPKLDASTAHFARKLDANVDDEILKHYERTLIPSHAVARST